jgi:three-Cys-motif partner protein
MPRDNLQLFGGDWTEQKLDILDAYLKAYNKALKKTPFTRVYIDAFAGTGYRQQSSISSNCAGLFQDIEEPEMQEFLKGSAKLALEVEPAFDKYVFIESDPQKVDELEQLRQEHPNKANAITIEKGDANSYIQKYCKNMPPSLRAVVFLDPFATQVQWGTIKAIAETKAIDVWILFPLMAVNRLLAKDHQKTCRVALDRLFGTKDWFQEFYCTSVEEDIFGQTIEKIQRACVSEKIGVFYLNRLKLIFSGVAPNPRMLYNSRGPLFLLFFASGNPKGAPIAIKIANHILENF